MDDTTKHGQGLRIRCESRRTELERALVQLGDAGSQGTRKDIEGALDALATLLTGDLDHISPTVGVRLVRWLDQSKHLGLKEQREIAAARRPA